MFEEWGFLLTEMWGLLALAGLIGLIAGWLIWGGSSNSDADASDVKTLRADLQKCRDLHADKDGKIKALQGSLAAFGDASSLGTRKGQTPIPALVEKPAPAPEPTPVPTDGGVKPATLDAPRDGTADDLKQIKGVGQKMEVLCNKLGFWHFDQIAAWSPAEVAWVDENLEGFKGRVTRDDWVPQAKILAAGGETEFSKKVGKGEVY